MNPFVYPTKRLLIALAAIILISSGAARAQNPQPAVAERPAPAPLNQLVRGGSITWAQGLKDEHKAWHQTKTWLKETTGRDVRERIEAHSGAMIGSAEARRISHAPQDGEVHRAVPTINEQIDEALKSYPDPSQVDLVLVDGCINDVDARRLLNAVNTPDEIHRSAEAKCGGLVESLLHRVTASFPNPHVIVTGYFPIISEETTNDFFMRALAKRLYTPTAGVPSMSDKEKRARLIAISKEWYQASNHWLELATGKADADLAAQGSRRRVL